MPRSRNTRSNSPLKSLKTTTGQSEYDRIFQNVQEMFSDTVDADVIYFVLSECHWRSEEAIDKLLTIVEKSEASPVKTKSKLQEIAEDVLGPLRHEECQEQGHTHPTLGQNPGPSSQATSAGASFARTIGNPVSSKESADKKLQPGLRSPSSPSLPSFQSRGGAMSPNVEKAPKSMQPVPGDPTLAWDFPPLQKDTSDLDAAATKTLPGKVGNESWRAIRAPTSLRTSSNSPHRNLGRDSEISNSDFYNQDVFSEDQNASKGKLDKPVRPRIEIGRNFPVRLLSKSPEETHNRITFPDTLQHSLSESVLSVKNKNAEIAQHESFELDETVIKCISEINNDLLDDTERKVEKGSFGRSRSSSARSQASENESGGTGASTPDPTHVRTSTPSNHPMTLPVIGLSVEAKEFVPRPKKTKTEEEIAQSSSDTATVTSSVRSSPLSAPSLKVDTKPIPIPVSSPFQGLNQAMRLGSPRIAVVSPGVAISPPGSLPATNSAHLTGSPMFITPKWQPVFPGIYSPQQPPPPLQPRLVAQQLSQQLPQQLPQQLSQQLPQPYPQGYRFTPPPGAQFPAYSGVVYPVGARPVFRVAGMPGMPPRLPQVPVPQGVQVATEVNSNMVARATGQPIMATREQMLPGVHPLNHLETKRAGNREKTTWIDVCIETVRCLMKAGKKIMVIVRGLPGSGKSTLARAIQFDGVVLSTDDYFTKGDMYEYDPDKLTEAHQWNRERAKEAIKLGTSPIIIDNTNTQKWEFKPYVSMALNNNYHVEIMEPDTPWKFKPKELAKRTIHGVPEDHIQRMLSRYEKNLSVALVSNNKANQPLLNGSTDSQTQNNISSKENSLSPAVERKPLKSARAEAARRSRSRGKSNKLRDSKASRKVQKQSNGSLTVLSDVTEQPDLHKTSPNTILSSQNSSTSLTDDWTSDDWLELNGTKEDFVIYQKYDTDIDLETQFNSDSVVVSNSGRSSVTSLQGEVNFIPHHANILSTTSSKTASPIIEFDIVEAYNPSGNHDTNILSPSAEYTGKDIESELSTEVVAFVNEVIEENSNTNLIELSQEDKLKLVEELKALLQFYPIEDEDERRKAEILICIKICRSEIEFENTLETNRADNIIAEHFIIQENAESGQLDEQIINGYEENIAEAIGQSTESDRTCVALQNVDLERVSEGSVDLDNSLNKEVANILNSSQLHEIEPNPGIPMYHQEKNEIVPALENNTEIKSNCNHSAENNEGEMDGCLETLNICTVCVAQEINYPVQEECVESQTLLSLSEIIPQHVSPKEKVSPREKTKPRDTTSIYEIDSAIIRAETSEVGDTDSLFENDSAIIAVRSTDSLDRDSLLETDSAIIAASTDSQDRDCLLETDSAIIAASTDMKDTNNLSVLETDSAIIHVAASNDLLDAEIIVEDSDVMKRLKATVEELKYWGHLETEESESVKKVVPEWDGFDQSPSDEWHNDTRVKPVRAKPQRKRRHKSESNNDDKACSKEREVQGMDTKVGVTDSSNFSRDEMYLDAAGQQDIKYSELLTNYYDETSSNTVTESKVDFDNPSYSQSCSYNNSEMCNTETFMDPVETGNYDYQRNEDILNDINSDLLQYETPIVLPDVDNTAIVRADTDLHKDSDLDNSIFVSDDEENLDNSHVSKSDSDVWKTASSDDNIFVSDDDMDLLVTNLKVDGLQTVAIQEEPMSVENSEACIKDNMPVTLTVSDDQEELVYLNSQSAESGKHVSSKNSFLYETTSSVGNENELRVNEDSCNLLDNDVAGNDQESLTDTDIIPLLTSSEINVSENANTGLSLDNGGGENAVSSKEGIKEHSVSSPVSPRKQKPSKRRLAAKLSKPFFDVSDAERFASNDWSSFSSVFNKSEATVKTIVDKTMEETEFKSEGTLTESGDFRLLNLFCEGESVEYVPDYRFMKTRSRSIDLSEEELARYNSNLENPVSSEVRKFDKSSSTDDLKTDSDLENIHFLKTCFPNISEDELDCVLINCSNNVEWALNLLLDWKYHLDYTDEEKEHFAKEISKCKRCPSPEHLDSSTEINAEDIPASLLDLCFKKIDEEKIAAREDLEKQLIQTGKERLDRIEDDNITKIRLRRSTSLSESSYDRSSVTASQSFERVRRSVSDPHQNNDSVFLNTSTIIDKRGYSVNDSVISPIKKIDDTSELDKSLMKGKITIETAPVKSGESSISLPEGDSVKMIGAVKEQNVTALSITDSPNSFSSVKEKVADHRREKDIFFSEGDQSLISPRQTEQDRSLRSASPRDRSLTSPGPVVLTLELDKSVISQLELLFGPVGENSITDQGDLEVPVNLETARLLHQCVRTSLQDDRFQKYKQMKADEEYARKLQAEQDHNDSQALQSPSGRPPGSLRGQAVSSPRKQPPVKPLTEIMEEEMSKQETREELQRYLGSDGGTSALATRMKRKKLYESFPSIDTTLLDQIFEANCYNLSETIELVQTSMSYQPVQTVMTREMEDEYYRQLVETVKQQSAMDRPDFIPEEEYLYDDYVDSQFEAYRGEATLHHKLRLECFQKAADAHRKGLKQVASFYSQEGHLHTQKLKEANQRAAENILEDRHSELETNMKLDLHGLHVDEAIAALDRILPQKEKERYKSHLTIVTGVGRHSHRGIPRLRPAVLAYLQKHQYSFTELHPGAFRITLKNR